MLQLTLVYYLLFVFTYRAGTSDAITLLYEAAMYLSHWQTSTNTVRSKINFTALSLGSIPLVFGKYGVNAELCACMKSLPGSALDNFTTLVLSLSL